MGAAKTRRRQQRRQGVPEYAISTSTRSPARRGLAHGHVRVRARPAGLARLARRGVAWRAGPCRGYCLPRALTRALTPCPPVPPAPYRACAAACAVLRHLRQPRRHLGGTTLPTRRAAGGHCVEAEGPAALRAAAPAGSRGAGGGPSSDFIDF